MNNKKGKSTFFSFRSKMMKKIMFLLLSLIMAGVTLTGCSDKKASATADAGKGKDVLKLIVAHNQTSLRIPMPMVSSPSRKRLKNCPAVP